MYNTYVERIPLEKLIFDEKNIESLRDDSYIKTYREFLEYFRRLDKITEHHAIIGISFTYSWMPTILEIKTDQLEQAVAILNAAKGGIDLFAQDLELLKKSFNNSLVGTSKLLHFINPERFAIWDSKVYRYLAGESPHQNRIGNCSYYIDYLRFCKYITKQPDFGGLHTSINEKVGYEVSPFRAVELVMFEGGG